AIQTSNEMAAQLVLLQGESAKSSTEFRRIAQAGGMAERGLATVEERVTKLGLSQQIVVGTSSLLSKQLTALGPIGAAASRILTLLEGQYTAAGAAASSAGVGIQFFNKRAALTVGLL